MVLLPFSSTKMSNFHSFHSLPLSLSVWIPFASFLLGSTPAISVLVCLTVPCYTGELSLGLFGITPCMYIYVCKWVFGFVKCLLLYAIFTLCVFLHAWVHVWIENFQANNRHIELSLTHNWLADFVLLLTTSNLFWWQEDALVSRNFCLPI